MAEALNRQKIELVQSSFLFENVDEIVVERIVTDERCYRKKYNKGQVIFDEQNFSRSLGIILSGEIQVEKRTAGGKSLKMSRSGPGGAFGAAAMFHQRSSFLTKITAVKQTEVLFLPEELLMWYMQRNPVITENYIRYLSDRIWFLNVKINALSAGTAEEKLGMYLLENGGFDQSMTELSQTLNMGRASLYRAIDSLQKLDLIQKGSKSLEVSDPEALRNYLFQ